MTQTEALKLALEALEESGITWKISRAITAIKEALAQTEQEPTRWWTQSVIDKDEMDEHFRKRIDVYADQHPTLLVNQLARRLRQAWNTAPPNRKPLTLDYIENHIGADEGDREAVVALVREVEAAHNIKE